MESSNKYFEADDDEVLSAEIIEFAREYQSKDFPNPDREGCPASEELLKIVKLRKLPDPRLREHLLSCSPCFLEFQTAKRAKHSAVSAAEIKTAATNFPRRTLFWRPIPVLALFLLICGITVVILYNLLTQTTPETASRKNISEREQTSDDRKILPNPANSPDENIANEIDRSSSKQNNQPTNRENKKSAINSENGQKTSAQTMVKLDLAKAVVLRNETSRETRYSLPSGMVLVDVKLPTDSPAGDYDISLFDEPRNRVIKKLTKRSNGKNLIIPLDLRTNNGRARLCIAPKGEIPDCFAVSIGRAELPR